MVTESNSSIMEKLTTEVDSFVDSFGHPYGNLHVPGAPWKILATLLVYFTFVLKVGPSLMRNRKALQVDGLMRLYNVVNVILNTFIFSVAFYHTRYTSKCWSCIGPYDDDDTPFWSRQVGMYGYMYLKVFDLLDTVFFVIRKKDKQVTVLHVIHHSIMPLTVYFGVKIAPYSPTIMIGILNTFVHMVMYSYYFLASYGPKMQPYLWWKKYLTLIQLVQFAIMMAHATVILMTADCEYPKFISFLHLFEGTYFTYAFGKFYVMNYLKTTSSADCNSNVNKAKKA